jgi:hypothetical protein
MRLQDGDALAAIECVAPAEAEENEADAEGTDSEAPEATDATDAEEAGSTEGEEATSTE